MKPLVNMLARLQIQMTTGRGGTVTVNASGDINIAHGAVITTNGAMISPNHEWLPFGNTIMVNAHKINMDGILYAGKVRSEVGDGKISLITNGSDGDVNIGHEAILQTENGGAVNIQSQHDVNQAGTILANGNTGGGIGGAITVSAANTISNNGRIQADGGSATATPGGDAGTMTFTAQTIKNDGLIRGLGGASNSAAGGNGSNVTFNGINPSGTGSVIAFGGLGTPNGSLGTITAPDPAQSSNTLRGIWKKP